MIQVLNRAYFISEMLIKEVFKEDNKYYVRLKTEEVQEISEEEYWNCKGK